MYILDTHILLWFFQNDSNLPPDTKKIIKDSNTQKFISIASLWEITIKYSLNKLSLHISLNDFFDLIYSTDINILEISTKHLLILNSLQQIHKDPFDRILIAQAIAEDFILITADENIHKYDVSILWN